MFQGFKSWRLRRKERRAAREAAWRGADELGQDGLSRFERQAIAALEPLVGRLKLVRSDGELRVLTGPIPGTAMKLYLYADEAQVWGPKKPFRRERWDYDSPEDSIRDLVAFVTTNLQSNNAWSGREG